MLKLRTKNLVTIVYIITMITSSHSLVLYMVPKSLYPSQSLRNLTKTVSAYGNTELDP